MASLQSFPTIRTPSCATQENDKWWARCDCLARALSSRCNFKTLPIGRGRSRPTVSKFPARTPTPAPTKAGGIWLRLILPTSQLRRTIRRHHSRVEAKNKTSKTKSKHLEDHGLRCAKWKGLTAACPSCNKTQRAQHKNAVQNYNCFLTVVGCLCVCVCCFAWK